jgi:hypothetical protein
MEKGSDLVFLFAPSKDRNKPTVQIITKTVMDMLLKRDMCYGLENTCRLYRSISRNPQFRMTAGWIFESRSHSQLLEGVYSIYSMALSTKPGGRMLDTYTNDFILGYVGRSEILRLDSHE